MRTRDKCLNKHSTLALKFWYSFNFVVHACKEILTMLCVPIFYLNFHCILTLSMSINFDLASVHILASPQNV